MTRAIMLQELGPVGMPFSGSTLVTKVGMSIGGPLCIEPTLFATSPLSMFT